MPFQYKKSAAAAAVVLGLATAETRAVEWVLEPGVGGRVEYTDNMFLSNQNKRSGYIATIGPGLRATRATEVSSFTMNGGLGYSYNSETNPKSYSVWSLGGNGRYRTERTTFATDFSLVRDSTLASELLRTGIVQERVQRNYYALTGSAVRTLTERWSANVGANASASRYDETGNNGLSDNNTYSGNAGLSYAYSSQTSINFGGAYTKFEATTFNNENRVTSGNVGISHIYSERLRFNLGVGVYQADSKINTLFACLLPQLVQSGGGVQLGFRQFSPAECQSLGVPLTQVSAARDTSSTGRLFDGTVTWQFSPRSTLTGYARQAFNPSGLGALVRTTAYGTNLTHQFSERLRGQFDLAAARSDTVGVSTVAGGTFYTALAGLNYRFYREWFLDGGYRHTMVDFKTGPRVSANAVFVSVRYEWPRISVSR
jgi:hypothetical protein